MGHQSVIEKYNQYRLPTVGRGEMKQGLHIEGGEELQKGLSVMGGERTHLLEHQPTEELQGLQLEGGEERPTRVTNRGGKGGTAYTR